MGFVFDDRHWPLLVIRYPAEPTLEQLPGLYTAWDAFLRRGRHAVLVELSLLNPSFAGPRLRKAAADEVEARRDAFDSRLIAEARVVPNALVRHVVTAFDWVKGMTFKRPLRNAHSYAEAEAWLRDQLAQDDMSAAPR
ncbi:MAG: hypothetical protein RL385_312 [Pseudomonadota bacterium]|jgi:hypothetical protein